MSEGSFYDVWEEEDRPVDEDQKTVVDLARARGKAFDLNKKMFLVRGYETFAVHAKDVEVALDQATGTRTITIKNARMVKYTKDGERKE